MSGSGLLCIYYKLASTRHAEVTRSIEGLQDAMRAAWPGLVCELLQRAQASDGIETWMETYRHPTAALDALATSIEQAASARTDLPMPRHAELFVAVMRDD